MKMRVPSDQVWRVAPSEASRSSARNARRKPAFAAALETGVVVREARAGGGHEPATGQIAQPAGDAAFEGASYGSRSEPAVGQTGG